MKRRIPLIKQKLSEHTVIRQVRARHMYFPVKCILERGHIALDDTLSRSLTPL
jgi:hypothetical protein